METDMRRWIYTTGITLSLAMFGVAGPAGALPAGFLPIVAPTNVEQVQFIFGGRNYCWYDYGWRGPGFYWCGYAMRRGLGWGGGAAGMAGTAGVIATDVLAAVAARETALPFTVVAPGWVAALLGWVGAIEVVMAVAVVTVEAAATVETSRV
jgi:hypothetical protein